MPFEGRKDLAAIVLLNENIAKAGLLTVGLRFF